MAVLKLSLLGPFFATLNQRPVDNFRSLKVQALLIYLAMERGKSHKREDLTSFLWPDIPLKSAQVNLRQAIFRLRQSIPTVSGVGGDLAVPLLRLDRSTISLNPLADVRVDVDEFLAWADKDPARAVSLYRGPFLADLLSIESEPFESWADNARENLARKALELLAKLTEDCLQQGEYVQAQTYAWRQLEIDNLREPAYRQLMIALTQDGQRNAALAQYQICQARLVQERGVEPGKETVALYHRLQIEALKQLRTTPRTEKATPLSNMPVFLLTDIEGSTRLWDRFHQEMLPALFQHNHILEKNITHYGGRILELRGDGVKAVFEAGDPLGCLIAIQKEMGQTTWGEIGNLRIRAGLHGVPIVRKGYDFFKKGDQYYGPVLNHTARIMDAGWGGQVLVSEAVHNTFSLPAGAAWQDFGLHHLKSLDQPVHIYGLTHPDMPVQVFPPLRTEQQEVRVTEAVAQPVRHNLPLQPTPFVGRKTEILELSTLLSDPHTPFVTIVGPGGMGKTRLALAVAEKLVMNCNAEEDCLFPDGVFFVPLAPLNDPAQIIPTIAKTLNVPMESNPGVESLERSSQVTATQRESLAGYLAQKRMLILLDNFEHLLEGAGVVVELLQQSPASHILVTSRERLHLREEQVYPLDGLEFPAWEAPKDPCDYTAMELFLQSARRLQPEFQLKPGDMVYLTRICRLVGGMPLGLELAASWIDLLSVAEIAAEIQASIDFLETDIRNIPDRHRSIRAVFDSSWNRLTPSEQSIFPRLSIFRGKFTREAAQEVAQSSLRDLANFTSKSLLQYDQDTHRYQLHELLRQYGVEKLATRQSDQSETCQRHCTYYCNLVDQHVQMLLSGEIDAALDRIDKDFANILKAWDCAIEHEDLVQVDKALSGMCFSYDFLLRPDEALAICQTAQEMLSKYRISPVPQTSPPQDATLVKHLQAKIFSWQGYMNLYYEHSLATSYLHQSMEIVDQLIEEGIDAREDKVYILFYLGLVEYHSGDPQVSKSFLLESLKLSRTTRHQWMVLRNLSALGDVSRLSGEVRQASRWYSQCLAESRAQNNGWGEILALRDLGWAARALMAYDEAERYYLQSLALAEKEEYLWEMVRVRESLGWLCLFLGRLPQAQDNFAQAVSLSGELGTPYRTLPAKIHISLTHTLCGEFIQAERVMQECLDLAQEFNPAARIFTTVCAAELMILLGRQREASEHLAILETLTQDLFIDRFTEGRITRVKGYEALAARDYSSARGYFEKSIALYTLNSDDEQIAWSQAGLAHALIGQGLWQEARQALEEALWTAIEIKSFIPLVFTLPVTVLYLAHENPSQAGEIFQQIHRAPFIANTPFFQVTVTQVLPAEIRQLAVEVGQQDAETLETLWVTAASVLSNWIQVWMESAEDQDARKVTKKA